MFRSKNKKKIYMYPCKPQFYYMYIKVGCKGVYITRTCFRDGQGDCKTFYMADVFFCFFAFFVDIHMDTQDILAPNVIPGVLLGVISRLEMMNSNSLGNFQEIRKVFHLR